MCVCGWMEIPLLSRSQSRSGYLSYILELLQKIGIYDVFPPLFFFLFDYTFVVQESVLLYTGVTRLRTSLGGWGS